MSRLRSLLAWCTLVGLLYVLYLAANVLGQVSTPLAAASASAAKLLLWLAFIAVAMATVLRFVGLLIGLSVTLEFVFIRKRDQTKSLQALRDEFFELFAPPWPSWAFEWWWAKVFRIEF